MGRDPRYDVLFEPVRIGPVTAPNRFYQVPHCTGMGYRRPRTVAEMRGVKAEGGWGVVSTEYTSFHPTSDDEPFPSHSIWDDDDIVALSLMTEKVHAHGSLAAVELWHGGASSANLYSREMPIGPVSRPAGRYDPLQTRALELDDIAELRRWHRTAARRAQLAGFDIVYVYACHQYLLHQFLDPSNDRRDEYGGPLENRMRLLRELIEDTKDEVGDTCAVAVRFSAGPGRHVDDDVVTGPLVDEAQEILGRLADLPDLWDVTVDDYSVEMGTSRFVPQGGLESSIAWVKQVTTKPVVSVGRFTSPEMMRRMVCDGVVDLIGAARPSIADPFLPAKIRDGRRGRDPRVHRVQHLLRGRSDGHADPVHAEPDDGRGIPQGMAPGADRPEGERGVGTRRRRRPGRTGSSDLARQARIWRGARRGDSAARRAGSSRSDLAWTRRVAARR